MVEFDRLGLYEKSMPSYLSIEEKLLLTRSVGCDWMEISIDETDARQERIFNRDIQNGIADAIKTTGVPIESMCLSAHRRYPLGEENPKNIQIMYAAIEFAARLGIRIIQLAGYDTYYNQSTKRTESLFSENLEKSVEYAAAYGVTLGFETMETDFMNTVCKAMKYVNRINSPYLTVYPDVGNIYNATSDPLGDMENGRGHISAVHLKETVPGKFRDLEFGSGQVDFKACIDKMHGLGVHRFTCEFWHDGKTEPFEYVRRNIEYVREIFARN